MNRHFETKYHVGDLLVINQEYRNWHRHALGWATPLEIGTIMVVRSMSKSGYYVQEIGHISGSGCEIPFEIADTMNRWDKFSIEFPKD